MRYISLALLVILFGYALSLVFVNGELVPVNLLFSQVSAMRLGLLLVITLALGITLGLLLGLQLFRVFQSQWEIKRLRKDIDLMRKDQILVAQQAATEAALQAKQQKLVTTIPSENKSPL